MTLAQILGELTAYSITFGIISYVIYRFVSGRLSKRKLKENKFGAGV